LTNSNDNKSKNSKLEAKKEKVDLEITELVDWGSVVVKILRY
jgi:hypothetical protein